MLLIINFSLSELKFEFIHIKLFVEIHKKKYQEVGRDKQV